MSQNTSNRRACKTYICRYYHDDTWWGVQIGAYDWTDAEERARKLGVKLDGEIEAIIPAHTGAGFAVRLLTFLRNLTTK